MNHVPAGEVHATQVLRDEHRWIIEVVEVLESLLSAPPDSFDFDRIQMCIDFIRLFADACHHGKEEDLLFVALEAQGMPKHQGPIAVMLHEHKLGRERVSVMVDSIEGARAGRSADRARLVRSGREYIDLIRGHILKEDNILFEMADQMLTGPACAQLCEAYDGTCDHTFEGRTKSALEALGREIVG